MEHRLGAVLEESIVVSCRLLKLLLPAELVLPSRRPALVHILGDRAQIVLLSDDVLRLLVAIHGVFSSCLYLPQPARF